MNRLEKKIQKTFDSFDEPLDENLKFRATFEANEETEIGECTIDIELLEYEKKDNEEKKYLIEFVRKGGKYPDYYYYYSKIKEIIIKEL